MATSGSTGRPKGAQLPAAALLHSAHATHARLGGPGTWLLALPLGHIAGIQVLVRSIAAGTAPAAVDLDGGFTPAAFVAGAAALPVTGRRYTALVPTQLRRLLDGGGAAVDALAGFNGIVLGGQAASAALLSEAAGAGATVFPSYGMSESCGGCVYAGRPLDGVRVDVGDDGRIRLGGPVVFTGYRLEPALTARALERGADGTRWHVTNDLGRLNDGVLTVLGRADDMILTGGENVAPAEVETALAGHPLVGEVAVAGRPDPEWGQAVVAVVVPRDPARPPTLADLRGHAGDTLPAYALPRELVIRSELPLLASGKVDRGRLL